MIHVALVRSSQDWDDFLSFSQPAMRWVLRRLFDVSRNPYFRRILMRPLVARREGKVVGRVMGVLALPTSAVATLRFFDGIDDPSVAQALIEEVTRWARLNGASQLRGPLPLDSVFDSSSEYAGLLEGFGFEKSEERSVFELTTDARFSEQVLAQAERLKQGGGVRLRAFDTRHFDAELKRLFEVYTGAEFAAPLSWEEFQYLARGLRLFWDPELVLIAEVAGEVAGFAVAVPDAGLAIQALKNSRLFPFGILRLLWNLRGPGRRRVVNRMRVMGVAIHERYAPMDLAPLFYATYWELAPKLGYAAAHCLPISDRDREQVETLEGLGASRKKVYRIYERALRG